jgi:hypothetical protein
MNKQNNYQIFPIEQDHLQSKFFRASMQLLIGIEQGHSQKMLQQYAKQMREEAGKCGAFTYTHTNKRTEHILNGLENV